MHVCSRFGLWAIMAFTLVLGPKVAVAAEPDIIGRYDCVGDAGAGTQYRGTVEITKEGDCYNLKWKIRDQQRYTGLGIIESNTLSVAIRDDNDEKYTAVIVYRIERGGKLAGRWSMFGFGGKTYTETLTPAN